jgi:hypothetical protein
MTYQRLPLFPLNTVVFPGASLTLHIFEERYRDMIGRCLRESSPFGVVLLREGQEVDNPATYHQIGTRVYINANVRLEDGRLLISTTGQRRFRVQYVIQHEPYIIASVAMLPEENSNRHAEEARELRSVYEHYWQAIATATGTQPEVERLPEDVVAMTYQVANRLHVTSERKQHWLEVDISTRIREIIAMLRAEIELLPYPAGDDPSGQSNNVPWSWN